MAKAIKVEGLKELEQKLDRLTEKSRDNLVGALDNSALRVLRSAQQKCPVDTGNLRASLTKETSKKELYTVVGTKVYYAPYVEYGTRKMRPKPYLKPAYLENEKDIKNLLKKAVLDAIRGIT